MKKIMMLLICIGMLCASLVACGGKQEADNELLGTWQPASVLLDGSTFTIEELESMGDDSLSEISIVIKDGGKAYIDEGTNGELVDWKIIAEGIMLGEIECPIDDEYIILENNGVQLYLEKISDEQIIAGKEQSDGKNEEIELDEEVVGLDGILNEVTKDFDLVIEGLLTKSEELFKNVGGTYDDYVENKQLILDYYDLVHNEFTTLSDRTTEHSFNYFRDVVSTIDHSDSDAIEDAMDELYDAIYEDAFDEFYDNVYEDIYDDIYDEYYDGIIDDAYDSIEYEEWYDIRSEAYEQWSDARSNMYEQWSDARSNTYENWSDVRSEFWSKNFDIEAILYDLQIEPSIYAKPVDGFVQESDEFTYLILSDDTIEITGYTGTKTNVSIPSEIDDFKVSRIGDFAFENNSSIERVILWADIISIGQGTFKGCTSLNDFSIPSDVTIVNDSTFEDCTNLETIIIWGDVTSIGTSAFKNCTSLTDISIPSEVTSVGISAFEGCSNLESVIVWSDDINFGVNAFADCPKLDELPEGAMNDNSLLTPKEVVETEEIEETKTEISDASDDSEWKQFLVDYEAWVDEYIIFMEKYAKNPTDLTLLTDYANLMTEMVEWSENAENMQDELSDSDLVTYMEAMARIVTKLNEAMLSMN